MPDIVNAVHKSETEEVMGAREKHTTILLNEHNRETSPLALLFPWTYTSHSSGWLLAVDGN